MMELENEEHKILWLAVYMVVLIRNGNNTDAARFAADTCLNDFRERFDVKKSESS